MIGLSKKLGQERIEYNATRSVHNIVVDNDDSVTVVVNDCDKLTISKVIVDICWRENLDDL